MLLRKIKHQAEYPYDLKLVARALLPPEIREGSRLKYEMMLYVIVEG